MMRITKELVNQLFEYKDGNLYWKTSPNKRIKIGSIAGGMLSKGYVQVGINGNRYYAHRIIFLMHHGYAPKTIDHIDCNKSNNRIENLREATQRQNQCNHKKNSRNTSGIKGVVWNKIRGKWLARIRVMGRQLHLGMFEKIEDAEGVVKKARAQHHGEFANHG